MLIQLLTNKPELIAHYFANGNEKHIVVLLQDGVYCAHDLLTRFPNIVLYALSDDWKCAGLASMPNVEIIPASKWVALCTAFAPVLTLQ